MHATDRRAWLVLLFRLPAARASGRVAIWRKLRQYGALAWKGSSYVLPHTPANLERFQWLLTDIRALGGDGSIVRGAHVEDSSSATLATMFNTARTTEYETLMVDIRRALRQARRVEHARLQGTVGRLSRRLAEIAARDEFGYPARRSATTLLRQLERAAGNRDGRTAPARTAKPYLRRIWMTRPRPEIDRVACAWFVRRFIDARARFVFSNDPQAHRGAIRFDMFPPQPGAPPDGPGFTGLFTHVGDRCTFEVLVATFRPADRQLRVLAQIVHDADLEDGKFGRPEGTALQSVLKGWADMGMRDREILERGGVCFDGLLATLPKPRPAVSRRSS